jgi:spore maturation protein CgeB
MPTWRGFARWAFQGAGYEAQDVLVDVADAELVHLEPARGFSLKEPWMRRLVWRDISNTVVFMNPGLRPVSLSEDYDLFIVYCQHNKDLLYINAINGWSERCRTSVCVMDEMWAADVPASRRYLRALERFDHVIVGFAGSVQAVSEAIGRRCHFVPPAVDAIRFSPYPGPPPRVVDIYSIGRRHEPVHRELTKLATQQRHFYLYDTLEGGTSLVKNYRQHRELFANIAKRSHGFMVAAAKVDQPGETRGQIEVPNRYYEGAAAGAVLIGQRPDCGYFDRLFDWPEAVLEVKPDGSDTAAVVTDLLNDPERRSRIASRNAEQALRRHDWVYRWQDIFRIAGFAPTPGMVARQQRLWDLAERARNDRGTRD